MITLISILQTFIGPDFLFDYQQRLLISAVKKYIRSYLSGSEIRKIKIFERFPEISGVSFDKAISELVTDNEIIDNKFEIKL